MVTDAAPSVHSGSKSLKSAIRSQIVRDTRIRVSPDKRPPSLITYSIAPVMRVNQRNLRLVRPEPAVQHTFGSTCRCTFVGAGLAWLGMSAVTIVALIGSNSDIPIWLAVCSIPGLVPFLLIVEIGDLTQYCCTFETLAVIASILGPPAAIVAFVLKRTWVWAVLIVVLSAIWFVTAFDILERNIAGV
jgi:hypothetical protein